MGPVFQARVLADFLVVFMTGQIHAQDGVVIVRREFRPGRVDELFNQLFHVDSPGADLLHADAFGHVPWLRLSGRVRLRLAGHCNPP